VNVYSLTEHTNRRHFDPKSVWTKGAYCISVIKCFQAKVGHEESFDQNL